MRNLHKEFTDIFPAPPLQIGTVTAIDAGGDLATVQLPGGGVLQVRGKTEVGQYVFVRNGVIEGEAPNLSVVILEI